MQPAATRATVRFLPSGPSGGTGCYMRDKPRAGVGRALARAAFRQLGRKPHHPIAPTLGSAARLNGHSHSPQRFSGDAPVSVDHGPRQLANGRRSRHGRRQWLGNAPSSRSLPLAVAVLAPALGLPAGQRPPAKITPAVGDAFRRHDPVAVQGPAAPLGPHGPQAQQPQQSHRGERRPAGSGVPCPHAAHAAPEQRRAGPAVQQAA